MNVEINHRHALQPVYFKRMGGGNGDVVEKTEAHCLGALGMVSRRPHAAKCVLHLTAHDQIRGQHTSPCRTQRSLQCAGTHSRIRVEVNNAALWRALGNPAHVFRRMNPFNLLESSKGCIVEGQVHVQTCGYQPIVDGGKPLGTFGMMRAHVVQPTVTVGNECGCHFKPRSSPGLFKVELH